MTQPSQDRRATGEAKKQELQKDAATPAQHGCDKDNNYLPADAPRNFIWRLHGGRRSASQPQLAAHMMVALVPSRAELINGFREVAGPSPYGPDQEEEPGDVGNGVGDGDRSCKGCRKIQNGEQRSPASPQNRGRLSLLGDEDAARHIIDREMRSASPQKISTLSSLEVTSQLHPPPERVHELKHDSSVLALAVSDEYIFAGTHNGEILIWSLGTFQLVQTIQAHKRSVLCLFLSNPSSPSQHPRRTAPREQSSSSSTNNSSAADDVNGDHSHDALSGPLLFSSAGDAIISVWCPKTFTRLYEIYSTHDVGDIFSVAYSAQHDTVYIGAQNTTIQWINLRDPERRAPHDSAQHPDRRYHRFFDSKAVGGTSTPRRSENRWSMIPKAQTVLEVDHAALYPFAHYGYVYCMLMAKGPTVLVDSEEEVLISGGGDGTIKMWKLGKHGRVHDSGAHPQQEEDDDDEPAIHEIMCLGTDDAESVMSLAIDGSFLYSGKLDGIIELWDLDTKQKLRVIKAHRGDIMTLQMRWGYLWSAAATGSAAKHSTVHYGDDNPSSSSEIVSQKYQCLSRWKAHDGKIMASAVTTYHGDQLYITGANDDAVGVWRVNNKAAATEEVAEVSEDMMFTSLREFVSFKTVSSRPEFGEDCRKGASFLCTLFKRLGGQVEMLSTDQHHNPVVCAKFCGKLEPAEKRKRILFYGHYDVVPADTKKASKWLTDPFQLKGTNGYLYGRGVSDNKGPIIAALYAVTDLMQSKQFDSDVIFLIEGEEESGSRGFQDTVRQNKELIGDVDYILLANSYWLDDETPCLTYGLRGVLHATVCVDSRHPDLHSGVDGSYMMAEPLSDLTTLLSTLKGPKNKIMIPGFYDSVLPLTPAEEARYDAVTSTLMRRNPENGPAGALKASLMARWREPNLTIHRYKVSGPDGSLVSSHASANISLRLVPGQEVDEVIASLTSFLEEQFALLESGNTLSVRIDNKAEPWLGDPDNDIFRTLEEAIIRVWGLDGAAPATGGEGGAARGRKPLYIREGGSIPAIRFLEKEFGAPAAHLPCGQATDSAHLDNERLRVLNLLKSREIFGEVFRRL
ncbi:WD repeat-containing protein [Pleurostoma richardsiae]|uniref:WD repeat-containing protein n=1 Tax=Pleurostoma richardsiae TaxID=41990 RepID=A0AA38RQL9_9PEZI|nr:WD repeat-containing protein [Pleurostoma richardsiae]